jgi:hypothetical protein
VSGTGNAISTSGGMSQVSVAGGTSQMTFLGAQDAVFVNGGTSNITDSGSALEVNVSATGGSLILGGIVNDPTALIDLKGGVGGYTSVAQIISGLGSDGNGGALLNLGSSGFIDFANLAPNMLHGANFQIG